MYDYKKEEYINVKPIEIGNNLGRIFFTNEVISHSPILLKNTFISLYEEYKVLEK